MKDRAADAWKIAKQQYTSLRRSLAGLEERIVVPSGDKETLVRAGFDVFLGSLDSVAGWVLADDEISRRGEALLRQAMRPGRTDPEQHGEAGDQHEQQASGEAGDQDEQQASGEAGGPQPTAAEEQAAHAGTEPAATPPPESATAGTVEVTFTLPAEVQASTVALCGEFNQWSAESDLLRRGSDGTWRATVALEPGRSYRYRFLLDGQRWENAWRADRYVQNPFGGTDSVIIVAPSSEHKI